MQNVKKKKKNLPRNNWILFMLEFFFMTGKKQQFMNTICI